MAFIDSLSVRSRRLFSLYFLVFLLVIVLFVSCKKETITHPTKISPIDTIKSPVGFIDTGSGTAGAVIVPAMYEGAAENLTFISSGPITLKDKHDTVISGIATPRISLENCSNITIRNCKIGPNGKNGINLLNCNNMHIDSCYIYHVATGIFASYGKAISITNCQAKNMIGPFPQGQFVQFNNISGGGSRISFNKFENVLGESYTEDAISLFKCNGLATDPIVVESNWIRGGGPSGSGGGIMLGDGSGSNQVARNNILVDAGQYGMAVSGGTYMSIVNNSIYGKSQPFTSEGIYYHNYTALPSANISIAKNAINYTNSKNELTNLYLGPGEQAPMGWNTNIYSPAVNDAILPASIVFEALFDDPIISARNKGR